MLAFLKTKAALLALLLLLIAIGIFYFVREVRVRLVDRDLGAALTEAQKLPPGFARGEDFFRRLKAINTNYAPSELKQAVSDYIAADENALQAMEAGRDASAEEKAMAEARDRIVAMEQKYR